MDYPVEYLAAPGCSLVDNNAHWNLLMAKGDWSQWIAHVDVSTQLAYGVVSLDLPAGDFYAVAYNFGSTTNSQYTITAYAREAVKMSEV